MDKKSFIIGWILGSVATVVTHVILLVLAA